MPSNIIIILMILTASVSLKVGNWKKEIRRTSLENMIDTLVMEMSEKSKCIVFIVDPFYRRLLQFNWAKKTFVPSYIIFVRESDEFSPPRPRVDAILSRSKDSGCDSYVILIANGLQVIELLQYAERERLMNTQGYFLLRHDARLFSPDMKYLWNRIVNVVFISSFTGLKIGSGSSHVKKWFNLESIHYPVNHKNLIVTNYLDTWYKGKFRYDNHFPGKTTDLQNKKLKVAVFEHIPAVTEHSRKLFKDWQKPSDKALGIEFEILRLAAKKMKFTPVFYHPNDIQKLKWGTADQNGSYDGLLGEAMNAKAAFFLGDLHYTLNHHKILELSFPYNTECLTFLTPESLTQNSWRFLVVPFTLHTWIAVIFILIFAALIFRFFAFCYARQIVPYTKMIEPEMKQLAIEGHVPATIPEHLKGLTLFTDVHNSLLYTFGMLLQVSLPRLPRPWAFRMFIGWWWLYSILVTVAYRASMTAVLARPIARITIDTLAQLAGSSIAVGGWGEDKKELFLSTVDGNLNKIGLKFELTNDEDEAVARVANGSFGYYENEYILQRARAKRQIFEESQKMKASESNERLIADRDLHIMQECVINMPISIGLDKNSPLKLQIDSIVRRVIESGLLEKWLSDVKEWSKIVEIKYDSEAPKALVDLEKLYGILVAMGIGYFLAVVALIGEKLHWKYIVMRNPAYDKYQMDVFYAMMKQKN